MIRSGPSWFNKPGGMNSDMNGMGGIPSAPPNRMNRSRPMMGGGGMNNSGPRANMGNNGGMMRQQMPVSTAPTQIPNMPPPQGHGGFAPTFNGGFGAGFNFNRPNDIARFAVPSGPSPEYAPAGSNGGMVSNNAPNMFDSAPTPYGNDAFIGNPMDTLHRRMGGNTGISGGMNRGIFGKGVTTGY